jgi:sugar/nucleoside kinase (ribokinase family)
MPLDILFEVERYPGPGTKLNGRSLTIQGGGPVPNVLVGLKRLGHTVALITAVADDLAGRIGAEELTREGIGADLLVWKKGSSDTAGGFVETGTGRRTIVLHRTLSVAPRDVVTKRLPIPRVIHLDGRDLQACLKLARWGRRVGATVCFDIGSVRNDVSPIFPLVDHLVVADSYALPFTGCRSAKRATEKLAGLCPGTVVVTEGIAGSIGREAGAYVRERAFKVKNLDTTGAGDAFHTGYIYGLLHGYDLAERLHFGAAVAALKCTRRGARAGAPTLTQVRRFLKGKPQTYA